jgi:CAAX prenyl protease-like protein
MAGFHSQAGWIAFNCVALVFVLAAQRIPWFSQTPSQGLLRDSCSANPTAAYLTPFLMILAAGMVSNAVSNGFEWLYPLRFAACAAALWIFRSQYRELDWRFGWFSPMIGGLAFVFWIALDVFAKPHANNTTAATLAAAPAFARIPWLVLRTAAAVITVPIAEELAFRGFLIRRLISVDFESVRTREFTYFSVLLSSITFGLLHGDRWFAGALAGLLYALALMQRGRIGDAIAAHATTNALLAGWILYHGAWWLW